MKKTAAKKTAAKKTVAKKTARKALKAPAKKPVARRSDFDAPVDGYLEKQTPGLRAVVETMQGLIAAAAPDAKAALKWGHPSYTIDGVIMCTLAAHKAHVNIVLAGPRETYADPEGRLEGEGATGCHLKARSLDDVPRKTMEGWLRVAAKRARGR